MKRPGLTTWILIGLVGGALLGHLAPASAVKLQWMASLFIRLIKLLVAPIILSTLVVGLAGAGQRHIGRLLLKSLIWFWIATAVALVVGLSAANFLHPGLGAVEHAGLKFEPPPPPKPFYEQLVPESIVAAMASNSILQIVCFSVLFAMALSAIGERGRPVIHVLQGVAEAMFKVTEYVMALAPLLRARQRPPMPAGPSTISVPPRPEPARSSAASITDSSPSRSRRWVTAPQ